MARKIIGSVVLGLSVLFLGPMVIIAGFSLDEGARGHLSWWFMPLFFLVPSFLFAVLGVATIGWRHWRISLGATLTAGALYGLFVSSMMYLFLRSPDAEVYNETLGQGKAMLIGPESIQLLRPLLLGGALFALGLPLLLWGLVRGRAASAARGEASKPVVPGQRPLGVTIVGWVCLVSAVWSVLVTARVLAGSSSDPFVEFTQRLMKLPLPALSAISLVGSALVIACSISILRRREWARWVLVVYWVVNLLASGLYIRSPIYLIPGIPFLLLMVFLLFRPAATAYFRWEPGLGQIPSRP